MRCQSPAYRSAARQAEKAHSKAKQVLTQAEQQEEAWHRPRAAFELLRADGSVNDRAQSGRGNLIPLDSLVYLGQNDV